MNNITVFYSWQSDKPRTRSFVEEALKEAIARVGAKLKLALILDQDSRDESGSPQIADSVQEKILQAVAFVADLTIVALREKRGGLPNGCVGIEWGWAEASLGSQALIGVMNTHYGQPADLPVDIRQSLVRTLFSLDEKGSGEDEVERQKLVSSLEDELILAIRGRFFRGFHSEAPRVIQDLVTSSPDGWRRRDFSVADLASASGLPEESVIAVMEDLVRYGLAEQIPRIGEGFAISVSIPLYVRFDPLFMGWNADQDAILVAQELVKRKQASAENLSQELGMPPRRLNPALFRLLQGGFADAAEITRADSPFYRLWLQQNLRTRAFAEGRDTLPSVAPRAPSRI